MKGTRRTSRTTTCYTTVCWSGSSSPGGGVSGWAASTRRGGWSSSSPGTRPTCGARSGRRYTLSTGKGHTIHRVGGVKLLALRFLLTLLITGEIRTEKNRNQQKSLARCRIYGNGTKKFCEFSCWCTLKFMFENDDCFLSRLNVWYVTRLHFTFFCSF